MSKSKALIAVLDHNYSEIGDAFDGIDAAHLHKRPTADGTLAISEIAAHISYCEAYAIHKVLLGKSRREWGLESPFFHSRNSYPPQMLEHPIHPKLVDYSAPDVLGEVKRIHQHCMDRLATFDKSADLELEGAWGWGNTIGSHLSYLVYHVAYHVGQIYLTRHFFGETTPG